MTKYEHLRMKGTICICNACGAQYDIGGQYLNIAELAAKQFMKNHAKCAERREGANPSPGNKGGR